MSNVKTTFIEGKEHVFVGNVPPSEIWLPSRPRGRGAFDAIEGHRGFLKTVVLTDPVTVGEFTADYLARIGFRGAWLAKERLANGKASKP